MYQVWDATTLTTYVTYRGHSSAVRSVAWTPDDKFIVSSDALTAQVRRRFHLSGPFSRGERYRLVTRWQAHRLGQRGPYGPGMGGKVSNRAAWPESSTTYGSLM